MAAGYYAESVAIAGFNFLDYSLKKIAEFVSFAKEKKTAAKLVLLL